MKYKEAYEQGLRILKEAKIAEADTDALYLLMFLTGFSRADYLLKRSEEMPGVCYENYCRLILRRKSREPCQYITGNTEFMGLTLRVCPDVLIPRQDTEILVERAIQYINLHTLPDVSGCTHGNETAKNTRSAGRGGDMVQGYDSEVLKNVQCVQDTVCGEDEGGNVSGIYITKAYVKRDACLSPDCTEADRAHKRFRVLDLCTGSGCIAIAMKHFCPQADVVAADISEAALDIARQNAIDNGAEITFIKSDMLENITGTFDLIVSNPPYVTADEYAGLEPEVKDYEPERALIGGSDGLSFYRVIAEKTPEFLAANALKLSYTGNGGDTKAVQVPCFIQKHAETGMLMLEVGSSQAEGVVKLLAENGFSDIGIIKDLAGLDRVVSGAFNQRRRISHAK